METSIVWFRKDLRLHDNPALYEAARKGAIVPVFILDKEDEAEKDASNWWLHHSLLALETAFSAYGTPLIFKVGDALEALTQIIKETDANALYFNASCEPLQRKKDQQVIDELKVRNIHIESFQAHLLFQPQTILNQQGEPYKVFTPFWKRTLKETVDRPLLKPKVIQTVTQPVSSVTIDDLELLSPFTWYEKFEQYWTPGEAGAIATWKQFTSKGLIQYKNGRDFPSLEAISKLSPHLAWGEISPKAIWYSAENVLRTNEGESNLEEQVEAYKRQLVWRDFGYQQLVHFPQITKMPLREAFQSFPWEEEDVVLDRWKTGTTGYPLVDAGMRELWETGFIHNRVRMVVASFLVKHLLIDWREGAKWFEQTLVDFDLANNAMGWQWVAGTGLDSAPYFRIFNPITQSEKFDKNGDYIRRWVPELSSLPVPYIHRPWDASAQILEEANVVLSKTYPERLIDHDYARKRALAGYELIK
ncbi:MAG: DNA photolyase family protein [Bacillaceae bacterium]|nr:DNA photolyase family protein [Bacillaceae bacterium]